MMSEWVLNEGVTTARTCSFLETCEVCCSVAPKNNAMKGATFYHIPGTEICPCWVVESWPSWQQSCWGTVKGIVKWIFSTVFVFLTIKECYLELWHHILSYSTWKVPNFTTKAAGLNNLSKWKHICMLNLWWKTVSLILLCIYMFVSLTVCSCVSVYNVKIVV